jgi:hypothetical protein
MNARAAVSSGCILAAAAVLVAGCATRGGRWRDEDARAGGRTFWVDNAATNATDTNPGSSARPWKTIARAGSATNELRPGDTVLIRSGVYRETVKITVSGAPGRPVTFAAAPGARVVIKGSEIVRAPWTKVTPDPGVKEPWPNALANVWKVKLGEEFLPDPNEPLQFNDCGVSKSQIMQVIVSDAYPLQPIGPAGAAYADAEKKWIVAEPIGRGLEDIRRDSFYFDPATHELYVKVGGEPGWFLMEVAVRNGVLGVAGVHDVVVRGLEVRHSRGSLVSLGGCERVTVEDCRLALAGFCNLGVYVSSNCIVRRCDSSWAGNTGMNLYRTTACTVEDCVLTCNNYRRFGNGWHDGAMKNIPGNVRTTIRRCEVAYNHSLGIWFDTGNQDIRILDNVCHHNGGDGIFHEGNWGGGVIAGNLCYANRGMGIAISDHVDNAMLRKTWAGDVEERYRPLKEYIDPKSFEGPEPILWVVNNTLAENRGPGACGLRTEERDSWQILRNVRVMNNLFLRNVLPDEHGQGQALSAEMLFWMHGGPDGKRLNTSNHSDYNVFTEPCWLLAGYGCPAIRGLDAWRAAYSEERHSRVRPVPYLCSSAGFRLLSKAGLELAGPLPEDVLTRWRSANPKRVGASLSQWPVPTTN